MRQVETHELPLTGASVIEASAGTGKTYTITSLFVRLLLERELDVDQVLVVTYTRAATAELRDRIRARLVSALAWARDPAARDPLLDALRQGPLAHVARAQLSARLERALADIDEAPILTIHGFCQRALREHAFESGGAFELELTPHIAPLLREIADDYYTRDLYDSPDSRTELLLNEHGALLTLAAKLQSGAGLRLLPEHIEPEEPDLGAWESARAHGRSLWSETSAEVCALVARRKGVGTKRSQSLPAQMEALLEGGKPGFSEKPPPFLKYFSQSTAAADSAAHPFFAAVDAWIESDRALLRAQHTLKLDFYRRFADFVQSELSRRARKDRVHTFDALLSGLDRALHAPDGERLLAALRGRYRAALVDEFQDTDPVQYRIFRRVFFEGGSPLMLIGDPKQAIYAFRGADVHAYMRARGDAAEQVFTLKVNYRADPALVRALNTLYAQAKDPFSTPGIDYHPVEPKPGARERLASPDGVGALDLACVEDAGSSAQTRAAISERVAEDILQLLSRGATRLDDEGDHTLHRPRALRPSDIAVLCRTNAEAQACQGALSNRAIPSVVSGDASVFDSEDVQHVERMLLAFASPSDPRALRSFLGSIYGGLSAEQLFALSDDDAAWDAHRMRFLSLHERFVEVGFVSATRALLEQYEVEPRLLQRRDGTRRITNLNHLCELLAEAAIRERLGPMGLLRWLRLAQSDEAVRAELTAESHELRLSSGDDAVQLTTVHKSKGLQYPIVYCPFLSRGGGLRRSEQAFVRFHAGAGGQTLDLGSEQLQANRKIAEAEARAEALRVLYVALTRAKHRVCLVLAGGKELGGSAPAHLLRPAGQDDDGSTKLTLETLTPALDSLVAEGGGCISLRRLPLPSTDRFTKQRPPAALQVRRTTRRLAASFGTGSFTGLTSGPGVGRRGPLGDVDYDASQAHAAATTLESSLTLDSFPRGAAAGKLVHEVLEHADFTASREALEGVVQAKLALHQQDSALSPMLVQGLSEVLSAPLDATGLTLSHIPPPARVNELEFLLPVERELTPRALSNVFRAAGAPPALPAYATLLAQLPFSGLRGFLRGFIDLVFRHEDRFYVVDYKSNHLGASAADYAPAALHETMAAHHYFLQYHLYTLAVDRYLSRRVAHYSYDVHFGGVFYLFLRGMAPEHPAQSGVFFDRPHASLIAALQALLGATPAGGST